MTIPVLFLPDDQALIPLDGSTVDSWAIKINLDPSRDWSGSTFVVDPTPFQIDDSHKGDSGLPYLLVYVDSVDLVKRSNAGFLFLKWNLSEDVHLNRTFLSQVVELVSRADSVGQAMTEVSFTITEGDDLTFTLDEAGPPGVKGDKGDKGDPGQIGPAGNGTTVVFAASFPAATWTVIHNLGRFPQLSLIDSSGAVFDADVEFPDLNTAVITHAQPITGWTLIS